MLQLMKSFVDHTSRIRFPECSKLAINWENEDNATICWYDVIVQFVWLCRVSLAKFSYWSKFHVNIIHFCFLVMTILVYKGLIRYPEIPLSDCCPVSGDGGELGIPSLTWISFMKSYWIMQNARFTAFTVFSY